MFNKLKKNDKKGFTLIEILIVIALLGVVATIAVPRFLGVQDSAKAKADIVALQMWAKEIEAQYMLGGVTLDASNNVPKDNVNYPMPKMSVTTTTVTATIVSNQLLIKYGTVTAYDKKLPDKIQ